MSDEMKVAIWRLILNHVQRAKVTTAQRRERLLQYKFRLLAWLETGGEDPIPEPLMTAYRFHWSLLRKITGEIANHRRD